MKLYFIKTTVQEARHTGARHTSTLFCCTIYKEIYILVIENEFGKQNHSVKNMRTNKLLY